MSDSEVAAAVVAEEKGEEVELVDESKDADEDVKPDSVEPRAPGMDVDDDTGLTIMESLCMDCGENGETRFLLTKVPYFRELLVAAFECPHCFARNNEIQFGGAYQEKGVRFELRVETVSDLSRQVIKSDSCLILIPDLELEIPAKTQRGSINTVEGVLARALEGLRATKAAAEAEGMAELADKLGSFLAKLAMYKIGVDLPFTFIVDDPAGNSFIENLQAPAPDPQLRVTRYKRTVKQDYDLGLTVDRTELEDELGVDGEGNPISREESKGGEAAASGGGGDDDDDDPLTADSVPSFVGPAGGSIAHGSAASARADGSGLERLLFDSSSFDAHREVMEFPVLCNACGAMGVTSMCVTDIPYFKEIIIMAFLCDNCGYRSNEVKAGGDVPEAGRISVLRVETDEDRARDVLKSDTASVRVPEIELELEGGTLGGMYTTVEGLLTQTRDQLLENNPFSVGDSAESDRRQRFEDFIAKLNSCIAGDMVFTLELADPLANSFIWSPYAPEPDPRLYVSQFERSWDDNETLGLNDISTEGYHSGAGTLAAVSTETAFFRFPLATVWRAALQPLMFTWWYGLDGAASDIDSPVGSVGHIAYHDGCEQSVQLVAMSELEHSVTLRVLESRPALEVMSVVHELSLTRVTADDGCLLTWTTRYSGDLTVSLYSRAKENKLRSFRLLREQLRKDAGIVGLAGGAHVTAEQLARGAKEASAMGIGLDRIGVAVAGDVEAEEGKSEDGEAVAAS